MISEINKHSLRCHGFSNFSVLNVNSYVGLHSELYICFLFGKKTRFKKHVMFVTCVENLYE